MVILRRRRVISRFEAVKVFTSCRRLKRRSVEALILRRLDLQQG
jgi:hypothetical protein